MIPHPVELILQPFWAWALEYHTLMLFSKRNHYELKVYTFSPWLLKRPGADELSN